MPISMLENINKSKRQFLNPQTISRHLYCSICHQIFENPSRLACSHTFCLVCIEYWGLLNKKCPICKNSIRQRKLQKDLIAQQIIDDLEVKCSHQNCLWTGLYAQLKKHQRTCQHKPKKEFIQQKYFGKKIQIQQIQDQPQQLRQLSSECVKKRKTEQQQKGIRLPNFDNSRNSSNNEDDLFQGRNLFEEQSEIVFYNSAPRQQRQLQRGEVSLQVSTILNHRTYSQNNSPNTRQLLNKCPTNGLFQQ